MASRQELEDALVAAHEAGDTEAAELIAGEIKANTQPEAPQPGPWTPTRLPGNLDEAKSYALNLARGNMRNVGLAGRTALNAVTAIPRMAMDAGVGVRNLVSGTNYEIPTQTWNTALDELGVPKPQGFTEKAGDFVGQMAVGGLLPAPSAATQAPANFAKNTVRDMTLAASQKAGYTVPPSQANPTALNKILEGGAGKLTTAQAAAAKNQATTNELAKKALGLTGEVTETAIKQAADDAFAKGYAPLRTVGTMRADAQYAADLAKAADKFKGASQSFPEAAGTEVTDMVAKMDKKSFDTKSALDMISILRDKASAAYRSGDSGIGGAYRAVSKALEDAIERGLARRGQDGAQLLKNFRDARQLIAKTHSVEEALSTSTGTVNALNLTQQMNRGVPLSGDLKTIADFGGLAPKAAREFKESLPGISPLDFYGAGGVSAITKNPWYLGGPFVRPAMREFLLSPLGQRLLTQPMGPVPTQPVMAGVAGLSGLLSQ